MANYTQHYKLHQWESTDNFLRTDFNTDLEKIDTVLGEKPDIVFGSYAGNNVYPRDIELGFQPRAVLLFSSLGQVNAYGTIFGGLFGPDHILGNVNIPLAKVTASGFTLTGEATNRTNDTYYYLALK